MISEEVSIISISNGSGDIFPENTLTNFKNKLPTLFTWRKNGVYRYHIAIEAIGLSTNFTTTKLPLKSENPSVVMGVPIKWPREIISDVKDNPKPIQSTCVGIDQMPSNCNTTLLDEHFKINNIPGSFGLNYFFIEYENMSVEKYIKFFQNIVNQSNGNLTFQYNQDTLTIEIKSVGKFKDNDSTVSGMHSVTHLIFHRFLLENIEMVLIHPNEHPLDSTFMDYKLNLELYNFDYTINGEDYYRIYLHNRFQYVQLNLKNISKKHYPNIIKVQCDQIRSQIFDSQNSKDLLIFHPDIPQSDPFFFHEVERTQFLPLENTILDDLNFKLLDEDNVQLNLNEGIATIVKLRLKKMSYYKKSFTVRLTSRTSKFYKSNTASDFTVNLPQTLIFDDERWKVSVSSINLPNVFSTLPPNNFMWFLFKTETGLKRKILYTVPNTNFTKDEFLSHTNNFFESVSPGKKLLHFQEELKSGAYEKTLVIKIFQEASILQISKDLALLLGYGAADFEIKKDVQFKNFVINTIPQNTTQNIQMSHPINIDYFQPSYAMLYSDIVKPTIIGSGYANILKVFPIFKRNDSYLIHQFKDPEHYSLQNNEIKSITLNFKNHSGENLNFASKNIVIVDLMFSNYT